MLVSPSSDCLNRRKPEGAAKHGLLDVLLATYDQLVALAELAQASEAVMEGMRRFASAGASLNVMPRLAGFSRMHGDRT